MAYVPKIKRPVFELLVPSQGRKVFAVPYNTGEEKILLTAQESGDKKDILLALKQIVSICVQDKDFDVNDLTTFDLEYMFLKLRARSVSNVVEAAYQDPEDGEVYSFEIDLESVQMLEGLADTKIVDIDNDLKVVLKYPSVTIIDKAPQGISARELVEYLISECIDYIVEGDEAIPFNELTDDERVGFLSEIPIPATDKIRKFFSTLPRMYYKIEFTNSKGTERVVELTKLEDFFILG